MPKSLTNLVRALATGLAFQTEPATLHRCAPGSASACLWTSVDLSPAALKRLAALDSAELASAWRGRLASSGELYAVGRPGSIADRDERLLVLLDVSGSMRGPKIGAARLVLREFVDRLATLRAKSVRVAIAPFGTVDVAARIAAAPFVGLDSARFAIDRLPSPGRENTALYSAIALGAKRLRTEVQRAGPSAAGLLLVITDGDNDVGRGDDPALLVGEAGLRTAATTVDESQVWLGILGIGALDQHALEQLAGARGSVFTVPPMPSAFQLGEPLARLQRVLQNRWDLQLQLGPTGRVDLGRQTALLGIDVGSGPTWTAAALATWRPPFVALPAYRAPAGSGMAPARAGLTGALSLWLPLAFVLLLLIQVWIVIPRVLWPDSAGSAPAPRSIVIRPVETTSSAPTAESSRGFPPIIARMAPPNVETQAPYSAADAPTVVGSAMPGAGTPRVGPPGPSTSNAEAPPRKPTDVTAAKARRT
jgi:hypothetical protein